MGPTMWSSWRTPHSPQVSHMLASCELLCWWPELFPIWLPSLAPSGQIPSDLSQNPALCTPQLWSNTWEVTKKLDNEWEDLGLGSGYTGADRNGRRAYLCLRSISDLWKLLGSFLHSTLFSVPSDYSVLCFFFLVIYYIFYHMITNNYVIINLLFKPKNSLRTKFTFLEIMWPKGFLTQ